MEINVGDYVRTKNGIIIKYNIHDIEYNKITNEYYYVYDNDDMYSEYDLVIKSSKDITDLVEVGDYVNGYRVVETYNATGEQMIFITILTDKGYKTILNNKFESKYIKSVLTKEQFEANAYKIEKER